jgi:hypothetical protein
VARDRQRAKQRQQARRAARLAERGDRPAGTPPPDADGGSQSAAAADDRAVENDRIDEHELEELADLEVGAPPEDLGFSERVIDHPAEFPDLGDDEVLEDELAEEAPARPASARRGAGRNTPIAIAS